VRRAVFALAALVILQALTFTVSASAGGDDDGGGVLDALGGFFEWILNGLKNLFIPRAGFFAKMQERLRDRFGEKFGGLVSGIEYLGARLGNLRAYGDSENLFILEFPASFPLLGGVSVNLLSNTSGVLSLIRGALSGFMALWTAAFAYRKIQALVNT
jgi:hypothetical protein